MIGNFTKYNGIGKIKYNNFDIFIGQVCCYCNIGYGVKLYNNGDMFEGRTRFQASCGFGTLQKANGDIFEGQFSCGVLNGIGKATSSNIALRGIFLNNSLSEGNINQYGYGSGKLTSLDGVVMEGTF